MLYALEIRRRRFDKPHKAHQRRGGAGVDQCHHLLLPAPLPAFPEEKQRDNLIRHQGAEQEMAIIL